jgi:ABC-type glycerol-3-phosphate transport system permease component
MKFLHFNNNFLLYVLPGAISAFNVILIKTYIEQLPKSLEDSAKIDGAGYFMIFSKIIFPLSIPIIATIAVFTAVGQWNTWFDNYFLVTNPKLNVLQMLLYNYVTQASRIGYDSVMEINRGTEVQRLTPAAVRMTITMVVTLPIIFIYPYMQKYFMKGIMLGAIKG